MSTTRDIVTKVFGFSIPETLYDQRDQFCPQKGHLTCSSGCPIYNRYVAAHGCSCNQALHLYPRECANMMEQGLAAQ